MDPFFEAQHTCAVSGHRSEETIKTFAKKCPPEKKRELRDKLSEEFGAGPKLPKITPPDTTHKVQEPTPGPSNFPTINKDDIVDFIPIPNKTLTSVQ